MITNRRNFLFGILAAPVIVRASSLMTVKPYIVVPALPPISMRMQLLRQNCLRNFAVADWEVPKFREMVEIQHWIEQNAERQIHPKLIETESKMRLDVQKHDWNSHITSSERTYTPEKSYHFEYERRIRVS